MQMIENYGTDFFFVKERGSKGLSSDIGIRKLRKIVIFYKRMKRKSRKVLSKFFVSSNHKFTAKLNFKVFNHSALVKNFEHSQIISAKC